MPEFTPATLPVLSPAQPVVWLGRTWNGLDDEAVQQGAVVTRAGRIEAVGAEDTLAVSAEAVRVRVSGTILPGLIDLHVHARPGYLPWFVAAGVTTVRDACNPLDMIGALLSAPGLRPRLLPSGPLLDGPAAFFRHFGPGAVHEPGDGQERSAAALIVRTPAEARRAVAFLAAEGVTHVKLYEQLAPEVFAAAAHEAARLNLPVMADLGFQITRGLSAQVDARQALACGVRSIEHASGYALAAQRAGLDPLAPLQDDLLDELATLTVQAGTALVPTLSVTAPLATADRPAGGGLPLEDLGGEVRTSLNAQWNAVHAGMAGMRHVAQADWALAAALSARVAGLGGLVGAGTDTPAGAFTLPGGGLHAELERLVHAGLSPVQALRAATGHAAAVLGRADLGRLEVGAVADLLIVGGDPLADIRATRDLTLVVQEGRPLPASALRAAVQAPQEVSA
ncbi:amidohydrolase family protein [Deinococcus taeanensis]|uniref:amidohydrolase family protein n=1 Tax=Deinococcus taeanensis TaxID=2737050 RepID=UPI001CDB8CA5|nr:amidohydrolase family protein [Deinococcus taeanensis]UBV41809.1 amidohydrolase family protein [Deinococcus taeanensis]